jgi:hypothetical protein
MTVTVSESGMTVFSSRWQPKRQTLKHEPYWPVRFDIVHELGCRKQGTLLVGAASDCGRLAIIYRICMQPPRSTDEATLFFFACDLAEVLADIIERVN